MKKLFLLFVLLIALGVIAFFVWNKKTAVDGDTVKIGVVLPLTGPVAEPGNNVLKGIQISIDKYNDTSSKKKITLIVEDSKSTPKDGVSALRKLIEVDKVKIVIGDIMSSVFLAMAPIAEQAKVVLISPGASNPAVRDAGDYIFRDYTSDNYDGIVMADYIVRTLNKKQTTVIYVNNDYGIGVKDAFITEYRKLGGVIPFDEGYAEGQTDFKTIAAKVRQSSPQCLYLVGNPSENGYLVKELKNQRANFLITSNLSVEDESFYKAARNSYDSIIFSSPYFDITKSDQYTTTLVNGFRSKYNKEPNVEVSLGYDVAGILITALKTSDNQVAKVKDALYQVKNYDGVTGKTSFDEKGDVKKSILIKSIDKNRHVKVLTDYFPQ